MTFPELCRLPATELTEAIRAKQLSPIELTRAILDRIEAVNPLINAYLAVDGDRALDSARAAEAAVMRGDQLGPLHGLPVPIKDLEPSEGMRHTSGSILFTDHVAAFDGAVTGRVKAAGGTIIGKTNTPHLGHKDMCDNLLGDPGRNPWNTDRTPGGSSGGAAAAVAAGLCPLAHGSDGAGSIRIPAALCGVFGHKPSFGRLPYWPNLDIWSARSHNGPISRTVADAALFTQAIAGPDPRDPTAIASPPDDYLAAVADPLPALQGLRVAWSEDFGYAAVDPDVRRLTSEAAQRFSDLGCNVEAVDPVWDNPRPGAEVCWFASMAARVGQAYDENPHAFEPSLVEMIRQGRHYSAEELGRAEMSRTVFYHQAREFFEDYDLLLTPQMPLTAWGVDDWPAEIDGTPTPSIFDRLPFTYPFNLTGQPAASVPCGFASDGLPVALQIVGRYHADTLVLQAAAAYENIAPWTSAWPDVS
ncbi:MAG: amidase family protein [Caldilineaceae bacterium]|nr:amidase family protein [Caldilineaceae bacterium]